MVPGMDYGVSGDYLREGKLQQAKTRFLDTVRLKPNSARAHCYLGVVLEQERQFTDAVRHLQRALEIDPNYEVAVEHLKSAKAQMDAQPR